MPPEAERAFIAYIVASIERATWQRPVDWTACWMRNSAHTLDILQGLSFRYHIDEPSRDEPWKGGDFVTAPYAFHMNDIVSFWSCPYQTGHKAGCS